MDGIEFSTDLRLPLRYRERVTSVAPGDARTRHGSTSLADGRNLIVGGSSAGATFWDTEEVYDREGPSRGRGSSPPPRAARICGRILVAGGLAFGGAVRRRSGTVGSCSPAGSTPAGRPVRRRRAVRPGRRGLHRDREHGRRARLRTAELFDPGTGLWTRAAGDLAAARADVTALLLGSGEVMVAGGLGADGSAFASIELFHPSSRNFRTAAAPLPAPRTGFSAHLLPDARALLVGGGAGTGFPVATATILD